MTIAAVGGSIVSALIGWLDSGERFNGRKFTSSLITAILAGLALAAGFSLTEFPLSPVAFMFEAIITFLAGAGIDAMRSRTAKAIRQT